jgi:hypothetical protein
MDINTAMRVLLLIVQLQFLKNHHLPLLQVVKQPRKKQKRTYIEVKDTVKNMKTGAELLELFKDMVVPEMKEFNKKARQWVIKSLHSVLRCLNNHFLGD